MDGRTHPVMEWYKNTIIWLRKCAHPLTNTLLKYLLLVIQHSVTLYTHDVRQFTSLWRVNTHKVARLQWYIRACLQILFQPTHFKRSSTSHCLSFCSPHMPQRSHHYPSTNVIRATSWNDYKPEAITPIIPGELVINLYNLV